MKKPVPRTGQRQAAPAKPAARQPAPAQRQATPARAAPARAAAPAARQPAQRQATPAKPAAPRQATPTTPQRNTLPAVRKAAPPPAELDDLDVMMQEDAGIGVSSKPEDNIVPNILVLQPLSPEVTDGDPKQIEGARPGDIYLRGTGVVIPGDEGIWFQPVEKFDKWLEFIPRDKGGGFVGAYEFDEDIDRNHPPVGAARNDKNPNRWLFPESGTECTHYHFVVGFLWDQGQAAEYVIPFKSTGHTVARQWNTTRLRQRFPNGKSMPAAANIYHLTTTLKNNKHGRWYVFEISNAVYIKSEDAVAILGDATYAYNLARSLAGAVNSGQKIIHVDDDNTDGEGAAPADGDISYQDDGTQGEKIPF